MSGVSGSVFSVQSVVWVPGGSRALLFQQVTEQTPSSKWRWMHLISLLPKLHLSIESHNKAPPRTHAHISHQSSTSSTAKMLTFILIKSTVWPCAKAWMCMCLHWSVCRRKTGAGPQMLDSGTVSLAWSSVRGYQWPLPTSYVTHKLPLVTTQ